MILGMNPKTLRERRPWTLFLWKRHRHWALVARPEGSCFRARVSDDFMYRSLHVCNVEIPSSRLCVVFELLVEESSFFLQCSVKSDFETDRPEVEELGLVGPWTFEDLSQRSLVVVQRYRGYSLVGCNCQHFVTDLAAEL